MPSSITSKFVKSLQLQRLCENFALISTTDDARLDIKAYELWELRVNKTCFDVKIFNPLTKSCPESSSEAYKYHESIKNEYEQRKTEVKKSNILSACFRIHWWRWQISFEALKQPVSKLSARKEDSYTDIISYLRTKISFHLPSKKSSKED